MKKLLLLLATAGFGTAQAQELAPATTRLGSEASLQIANLESATANKGTAQTDTGYFTLSTFVPKGYSNIYLRRIFDSSTVYLHDAATPIDSGYITGTSPFLDRGFAEQFYFRYKSDTALLILGFRTLFTGRVQSTSTKQLSFNIWKSAAESKVPGTTGQYDAGLPGSSLASLSVMANKLGTGGGSGIDSFKNFYFNTPYALAAADSNFFMGFSMPAYTWATMAGDTFAIRSSRNGSYSNTGSYLRGTDTVHRNQNVYMNNAGAWSDLYWDYNRRVNLSIVPIVKLTGSLSVDKSFESKDLAFMGNYPNPAKEVTNIHFSLQTATNVSLIISDMNGRTVRTEPTRKFAAGKNELQVNVSELPAGNYIYTLATENGGAVASQLTVVR